MTLRSITAAFALCLACAGALAAAEQSRAIDVLSNQRWEFSSAGGIAASARSDGEKPFMIFESDGTFHGFAGCNRFFGSWTAGETPEALSFGNIGRTMMIGPDMDFENRLMECLGEISRWSLEGNRLTLSGAKSAIQLVRPASLPLEGTLWNLSSLRGTPLELLKSRTTPTLKLNAEDHKASGQGFCNRYFSAYHLKANSLTFGAVASTRMAGPDLDKESDYFRALSQAASYRVIGGELILMDKAGTELMRFESLR